MKTAKTAILARCRKSLIGGSTMVVAYGIAAMSVFAPVAPALASGGTAAWDITYPNAVRFVTLPALGNAAVLDKETDLVWEKSPSQGAHTWNSASNGANDRCNRLVIGARMGWRLPTIQELTSVMDMTSGNNNLQNPAFTFGVWNTGEAIWSATTDANATTQAWTMNLAGTLVKVNKGALARAWCVRFRQGVDAQ